MKILITLLIAALFAGLGFYNYNEQLKYDDMLAKLNTDEYCKQLKYPVETHEIQTKDGYILTFFRVQAKNTQMRSGLPVVYWQHGLEDSSDLAVMANEEEIAPALMLANIGFDVWLGNSRGNFYSKRHIKLKPIERQFWQFTFQHMAEYDLTAAFEYITNYTQKSKINYIGHSQGSMQMHAALSLRLKPIVEKVATIISLGPVAYITNINSEALQKLAQNPNIYPTLDKYGLWNTLPKSNLVGEIGTDFCKFALWRCKKGIHNTFDLITNIDNFKRIEYVMRHFPMGTSLLNIAHYQQMVLSNEFKMYDYGPVENIRQYNQSTAPFFDLSKIVEPVHLFVGDTDVLANPVDAIHLYHDLTNSVGKTLNMYHLGHATFLFGKDKIVMSYMDDVIALLDIK